MKSSPSATRHLSRVGPTRQILDFVRSLDGTLRSTNVETKSCSAFSPSIRCSILPMICPIVLIRRKRRSRHQAFRRDPGRSPGRNRNQSHAKSTSAASVIAREFGLCGYSPVPIATSRSSAHSDRCASTATTVSVLLGLKGQSPAGPCGPYARRTGAARNTRASRIPGSRPRSQAVEQLP